MSQNLSGITALLLLVAASEVAAQSVTFRTETFPVSRPISTTTCVQVGIFMSYTGPTATWGHYEASLDYTLGAGVTLSGSPFVDVSDFGSMLPGLTDPPTLLTNSSATSTPCAIADVTNQATLTGGADQAFMDGAGGSPAIVNESVSGTSVDITSLSFGSLFTTQDGMEYLMAILEFPVAASPAFEDIAITFRAGAADNFISDGVTTLNASLQDGSVSVPVELLQFEVE